MKRTSDLRFARIPYELLTNHCLNANDVRVFGILAATAQHTNIAAIGQRRLSDLAQMNRRTIRNSLEALARQGYISKSIFKLGGRSVYQLNHALFDGKVEHPECSTSGRSSAPRIDIEYGKVVPMPRKRGAPRPL